jgi:hypothetical protein
MRGDSEQFQPLGPKVEQPAPAPPPEWKPTDTPNVYRAPDGKLKHMPPVPPPEPSPWLYIGTAETWGRAIESLRQEAARQRGR